jgi:hypothetical protein
MYRYDALHLDVHHLILVFPSDFLALRVRILREAVARARVVS